MPLEQYNIIRTYLPKEGHSHPDILGAVVSLLQKAQPVGCVGQYDGVYELHEGQEGFTPLAGSNPTLGAAGNHATTGTWIFTTYVSSAAPKEKIVKFVDDLAAVHPWEHPVIEVIGKNGIELWMPANHAVKNQNEGVKHHAIAQP